MARIKISAPKPIVAPISNPKSKSKVQKRATKKKAQAFRYFLDRSSMEELLSGDDDGGKFVLTGAMFSRLEAGQRVPKGAITLTVNVPAECEGIMFPAKMNVEEVDREEKMEEEGEADGEESELSELSDVSSDFEG